MNFEKKGETIYAPFTTIFEESSLYEEEEFCSEITNLEDIHVSSSSLFAHFCGHTFC